MADFVTLSCPSCGGKLQITNDLDRFACGYCGTEQVVRRGGGVVSLAPIVEVLKQVQSGVDRAASELAIKRLKEEVAELTQERQVLGPGAENLVLFGIIVLGIVGLIVGVLSGVWGLALVSALLAVGAGYSLVRIQRSNAEHRRAIDRQLGQKLEELQTHQRIVSA
jgi:hypothetical protein